MRRVLVIIFFALHLIACASAPPQTNNQPLATISAAERNAARQQHRLTLESLQAKAARSTRKKGVSDEMAAAGLQLFVDGYYLGAIDYFRAAVTIQEDINDSAGKVHNLNNLARLYTLVGNQTQARKSLDTALSMAEQLNAKPLQTSSLINLANLQLNLREYQAAHLALQDAIALSEQAARNDLRAEALTVLGAVYRQQGNFEQAIPAYQQALNIYKRLRRGNETAASLRVLGELYLHRGEGDRQENLQQAYTFLSQAQQQHKRYADRLGEAMTLSHLGEHGYETQNYDAAIDHYRTAQSFFEATGFLDGVGRMYVHLGFAYGDLGQIQSAIESFDEAIAIYHKLNDREWQRIALFGRAVYLQKMGDISAAEQNYRQAVDLFESIRADVVGGETKEILFTKANRELYERLVELLLEKGDVETALEYVERSRLRELRNNLFTPRPNLSGKRSTSGIKTVTALYKEQAYIRNQRQTAQDPEIRKYLSKTLARNENEADKVIHKLTQRYPDIKDTIQIVSNTYEFRQSDIFPEDLALVIYFSTSESLYIFVVKKNTEVVVEKVAISDDKLAAIVKDTISQILASKDRPFKITTTAKEGLEKSLTDLSQVLIDPIDERLNNIRTLAILPVKWLNFLPFEALIHRDSDGKGQFLQQSKRVMYLFSQTYVNRIFSLANAVALSDSPDIVAFGNPDIGDTAPALPFAALEVQEIKRLFPDSLVFVADQASKTNFNSHWGKHEILHVAAHARLRAGQADILLAPGEKGTVSIDELYGLGRSKTTRFVALSACQTALDPDHALITWKNNSNTVSVSGPFASVAHTLLMKKIPAVAATLWEIDDQATAMLMSGFYQQLKHGGGIYDALRQAQLSMMQRQDVYSQPYYWAGFVYYGLE